MKSLPQAGQQPTGQQPAGQGPEDQEPADDGRQWAGDPYDDGDETLPDDPAVTARFSAPGGEEAWLERAADGTLTGWLRDPSGQVYRYSDADAWAVDVDDAGMTPSGGGTQTDEQPADGEQPENEAEPDGGSQDSELPDEFRK
ncbi:hypothetical protein [Streptomyces sp. MJM8645]|uniref:hypothetical protein n=1 Tax=Streptomycetaceae TaxID=2062 RepID=UPI0007AF946F|nr:hypothetical protein [Streptomyces sp. MJM8645]